jgi:hypothetical protein
VKLITLYFLIKVLKVPISSIVAIINKLLFSKLFLRINIIGRDLTDKNEKSDNNKNG